jgi:hypothetical protein
MGTVGLIGSDDLLACFVAGNSFTWNDWFRLETEKAHLPEVGFLILSNVNEKSEFIIIFRSLTCYSILVYLSISVLQWYCIYRTINWINLTLLLP